jgi:hypothetical protein
MDQPLEVGRRGGTCGKLDCLQGFLDYLQWNHPPAACLTALAGWRAVVYKQCKILRCDTVLVLPFSTWLCVLGHRDVQSRAFMLAQTIMRIKVA